MTLYLFSCLQRMSRKKKSTLFPMVMVAGVQTKKMGMASFPPPLPLFCGFGSNRPVEKDQGG